MDSQDMTGILVGISRLAPAEKGCGPSALLHQPWDSPKSPSTGTHACPADMGVPCGQFSSFGAHWLPMLGALVLPWPPASQPHPLCKQVAVAWSCSGTAASSCQV